MYKHIIIIKKNKKNEGGQGHLPPPPLGTFCFTYKCILVELKKHYAASKKIQYQPSIFQNQLLRFVYSSHPLIGYYLINTLSIIMISSYP